MDSADGSGGMQVAPPLSLVRGMGRSRVKEGSGAQWYSTGPSDTGGVSNRRVLGIQCGMDPAFGFYLLFGDGPTLEVSRGETWPSP